MTTSTADSASVKPIAEDFKPTLQRALAQQEVAEHVARDAARRGLANVYLVGAGGSLAAMYPVHYELERGGAGFSTFIMTSNELNYRRPAQLGERSLVVTGSHTGTTKETVRAAETAKAAGATVVAVTRLEDSPLAKTADVAFSYGSEKTVYEAKQILLGQLGFAVLQETGVDKDYGAIRRAFEALPEALYETKVESDPQCHEIATQWKDESITYVLAAGPNYGAGYCLAMCYLQEMQWMHAASFNAGEFFHGAVEVVTDETPWLVLLGEDDTRPMAERALTFLQQYTKKTIAIDSRNFSLPGVEARYRPIVTPLALSTVITRLPQHYEAVRGHSLELRRYMFKVDY
jgi:fructoselysine 6-phosphate deglycase